MTIVLINFADENFEKQRDLNTLSAKLFGGFDKVLSFSKEQIESGFYEKNHLILNEKRGAGYWLWKPYFIDKVLNELSDGDYLFYCDAGCIFINNVKHLIRVLDDSGQSIMSFELPLVEYEWTAESVLNEFDAYKKGYAQSNQISATYLLLKKSNDSVRLIKDWLEKCTRAELLTDDANLGNIAKAHRHDQSIFSLIIKSEGYKTFKDPSDYGRFPWRYFTKDRYFNLKEYESNYPVILLSNRKENAIKYLVKYYIRSLLQIMRIK